MANGPIRQHHVMAEGKTMTGMKKGGKVTGASGSPAQYAKGQAAVKQVRNQNLAEDAQLVRPMKGGGRAGKRGC